MVTLGFCTPVSPELVYVGSLTRQFVLNEPMFGDVVSNRQCG